MAPQHAARHARIAEKRAGGMRDVARSRGAGGDLGAVVGAIGEREGGGGEGWDEDCEGSE